MRLWPRKRVYLDDLPRTHDVRFGFLFLLLFVGVLGLLYVVGYFVAGDKVPARTSVAGIDIGGMTRAHAATVLEQKLASRTTTPVIVSGDAAATQIEPREAGLRINVQETIDQAMAGGNWDPRHMLRVLTGGGSVDPVVDSDRHTLIEALQPIAAKVARKPVDASMTFTTARPVLVPGQPGRELDVDRTAARLQRALVDGRHRITLATHPVLPDITSTEVVSFIDGAVGKAMSGPITITADGHHLTVQPNRFGPAFVARSVHHSLKLGIDPNVLYARTHWRVQSLPDRPQEAQIAFQGGHPVVEPSHPGRIIPKAEWARAVMQAATSASRTATATTQAANPHFTTAAARSLDIRVRISTAVAHGQSTFAAAIFRKAHNLDGVLLRPRETFSLLDRLGRTREPRADSVVGSALYRAVKGAGLPIGAASVTGTGVSVSPPGHDLRFTDDRRSGVYIRCFVRGSRFGPNVHVELWSGAA